MSGKILYIEDDIVTAAYVQTQLEQYGYVVDIATDGKDGLDKIGNEIYDVVAVDYHLPDMSGLQILRSLADDFRISTIMITGAGDEKIAVEAMKLGAGDYLIKDVNHNFIELLPTIIESEIEKQQLIIAKHQAEKASRYRENILEAVSFAAENFLTCIKWSQPIPEVLARLGRTMSISRVYISENHHNKKGTLLSSRRYEWVAENVKPQIDETQNFPYSPNFEFLTKILSQGQVFHGSVQNFPKQIARLFIAKDIRSVAIVPLFVGKKWWGFIGYDDCIKEQEWLPIIIEAFKTAANLLGAAIQHEQMNQALRDSEARLAETQEIAKLGQCDWNICNNTRYLSEETLKIFDWPLDKHIVSNSTFLNAIHPDDRRMVKNAVFQAIHFNKIYDIEFRIIRPDNSIRYLHVISKLFRSDDGKPTRFLSTTQDITERKIAEKNLEENTQTLSAILNAATDSIIMMELDTTCVIANPAGANRLGLDVDEIIGKPICDLVAPQTVSKRKKILDQIVHNHQPMRFEERDQTNAWFDHSIYPVFDENDNVTRIAMVSRNITERKEVEEDLRKERDFNNAIINAAGSLVTVLDTDGNIVLFNKTCEKLTGYIFKEVEGHLITDLFFMPQDREQCLNYFESLLYQKGSTRRESYWLTKDKRQVFISWYHAILYNNKNEAEHIVGVGIDITARKQAEENQRLAVTVFETTTEGIIVTDANNNIIMVNPAFTLITGYKKEEVIGKTPDILRSGDHTSRFYQDMWNSLKKIDKWQGELWNRRKNGEVYIEWLSISTIRNTNNEITQYVAIFDDITERKQAEELIWHQAHHDALTDLPNRTLFVDRLSQTIQVAKRRNEKLAVMFIDLDRFKQVNDTLGHKIGDCLLQETSKRLQQGVREFDTVARLGGDEFTIIINNFDEYLCVKNIAETLLNSLSSPFFIENNKISIAGSIGIAFFPEDGSDVETLLKNADIAMYQAKEGGRNSYQFFTSQMNTQIIKHLQLEESLRNALENNEFELYYQPIVELESKKMIAIETSLRWKNNESIMFPEQFLEPAEKCGLIVPIWKLWLSNAIEQLQQLHSINSEHLQIAVKISAHQLKTDNTIKIIKDILQKFNLKAHYLILEIDEEAFLKNLPETANNLDKLESLGAQIAIDNFGSDWGSLHALRQFPINIIKIDPFFVHNITADSYDTILIQTIIALAHKLNIKVVGGGVETEEQLAFLHKNKCDLIQGSYITKPFNSKNFIKFVNQNYKKSSE
ncbi:PAS domain S-box protein [Candidatus Halobeggiatoa sp. HSG11]|nr:PAS domain S-box protein [Candidatus Halobeggiatoa sp. HSG11]